MRFILVNGRTPCAPAVCAMCRRSIRRGYLRENGTHLIYCDQTCYADHCESVDQLLDSQAKAS